MKARLISRAEEREQLQRELELEPLRQQVEALRARRVVNAVATGRAAAVALRAYLAWLAAVTALAATAVSQLFGETPEDFCREPVCATFTIVSRQPGWGAWVTLGALVLLWVAAAARLFTPRGVRVLHRVLHLPHAAGAPALCERLSAHRAAAPQRRCLHAGHARLGVRAHLGPWATNHCTGFPLAWTHVTSGVTSGSCAGLDANDAIPYAWPATTVGQGFDFTMFLVFMGLLGIVAMSALWRKGWGVPVVATIWAALATWLVLQLSAGLAAMLEHPPRLAGATSGAWVSGAGPLVTGVRLTLAGIAFLAAWIAAWIAAADSLRGRGGARDLALVPDAPSAESIY